MKRSLAHRTLWLAGVVALASVLLWLDQSRGGPSTMLSRCNLLLSRNQEPAADVLIVGSSRSGAALDPLAMQEMLAHALPGTAPTVERIALGRSPMRASLALLENYIDAHGAPEVIALELMFMTQRSVDHLASQGLNTSPEHYLFRRDINLMTFGQILALPSVAMPFTEKEGWVNRLRLRLRGVVLRAGALTYQFLRHPQESWDVSACAKEDRTHEPTWPPDFAFSYGSYESDAPPATVIEELEAVIAETAPQRALKSWQMGVPTGQNYPYDLGETYRAGEAALLGSMLKLASRHDVPVVLLPLPLYGYSIGADDLQQLNTALPGQTQVFDLYTQVRGDLDKFWYDDGHLELYPAGALTTAILAQHLLDTGLLAARATEQNRD